MGASQGGLIGGVLGSLVPGLGTLVGVFVGSALGALAGAITAKYTAKVATRVYYKQWRNPDKWQLTKQEEERLAKKYGRENLPQILNIIEAIFKEKNQTSLLNRLAGSFPLTSQRQKKNVLNALLKLIREGKCLGKAVIVGKQVFRLTPDALPVQSDANAGAGTLTVESGAATTAPAAVAAAVAAVPYALPVDSQQQASARTSSWGTTMLPQLTGNNGNGSVGNSRGHAQGALIPPEASAPPSYEESEQEAALLVVGSIEPSAPPPPGPGSLRL